MVLWIAIALLINVVHLNKDKYFQICLFGIEVASNAPPQKKKIKKLASAGFL